MQKSFNNNPSRREQRLRLGQGQSRSCFDNIPIQFKRNSSQRKARGQDKKIIVNKDNYKKIMVNKDNHGR